MRQFTRASTQVSIQTLLRLYSGSIQALLRPDLFVVVQQP
jgi:hypothetical protein